MSIKKDVFTSSSRTFFIDISFFNEKFESQMLDDILIFGISENCTFVMQSKHYDDFLSKCNDIVKGYNLTQKELENLISQNRNKLNKFILAHFVLKKIIRNGNLKIEEKITVAHDALVGSDFIFNHELHKYYKKIYGVYLEKGFYDIKILNQFLLNIEKPIFFHGNYMNMIDEIRLVVFDKFYSFLATSIPKIVLNIRDIIEDSKDYNITLRLMKNGSVLFEKIFSYINEFNNKTPLYCLRKKTGGFIVVTHEEKRVYKEKNKQKPQENIHHRELKNLNTNIEISLPEEIEIPTALVERINSGNPIELKTKDHQSILLSNKISEGGEGSIFYIKENESELVKIFTKKIYKNTEKKLDLLSKIDTLKADKNIACPKQLLYYDNFFVGYKMNKVLGEQMHILNYTALLKNEIKTRSQLVSIALNYIKTILKIHKENILLVDINDGNILIDKKSQMVSIVDLDSAQIDEHPCLVGIDDYFSENIIKLQKTSTAKKMHTLSSLHDEMFSIYIFVFRIVMGGRHPYDHKQRDISVHKNIQANFVYPFNGVGNSNIVPGSVTIKLWELLSDDMKNEFCNAFRNKSMDLTRLKKSLEKYLDYIKSSPEAFNQIFF